MKAGRMKLTVFSQARERPTGLPRNTLWMPPAASGDVARCVVAGVTHILLLDGQFLEHLPPNHYELLSAIQSGVRITGASSMGALRAAELDACGMAGAGVVYRAVKEGLLKDDGEIAVAYDARWNPTTVPLINLRRLLHLAIEEGLSKTEARKALRVASSIYFLDRTWSSLGIAWRDCAPAALRACEELKDAKNWDVKQTDAHRAISFVVCTTSNNEVNSDEMRALLW
jgi:hypothetical protein